MTTDSFNHTFTGVMKSLNLDPSRFPDYSGDFSRHDYAQLAAAKHDIETQLAALFDMLTVNFAADMSTSLVTEDGFPRGDIDVVSIRLIRVRILRLQNDWKSVLQWLETKLSDQLAKQDTEIEQEANARSRQTNAIAPSRPHGELVPFAIVTEITENSPAARAGLQLQDRIITFSDIHAGNHDRLRAIAGVVAQKKEEQVDVTVFRDDQHVRLELIPSENWLGQGLLGCRLVPL